VERLVDSLVSAGTLPDRSGATTRRSSPEALNLPLAGLSTNSSRASVLANTISAVLEARTPWLEARGTGCGEGGGGALCLIGEG
jgi:hypothetical protein